MNGERNEKGKEFDYSGKLLFQGKYLNDDKLCGKRYDKNNNMIYEINNNNGNGKEYDNNGVLKFEGEYLNGVRNGKGKEYMFNDILFEVTYANGKWNRIVKEYNLAEKIDDKFKLHQCFMQTSFFQDALNLAQSNVRTQDLNARIEWLVAASQALYKLERYDECIKACDDAITIATKVAQSDPSKALYYRFYSLIAKKRFNEAISNILALEELRGGEDRLTEVYDTAAKFAILNGFDSAALNYSQKAIKMQKRLKINTFSPEIDFIYVSALLKNSQTKDALKAAQNLLKLNLNDEQKSRALYQNAEIYLKLDDKTNAKNMIDECLKQPGKSAWKNLCIEQNQIIKN